MRDKADADVIAYLEAENAYTEARTSHLSDLTEAVFSEIKARTQETDLSVPTYTTTPTRRPASAAPSGTTPAPSRARSTPIYCRTPATAGPAPHPTSVGEIAGEQILLDANAEAEGEDFFSLGAFTVSPSGRLLAYATDTSGDERFTARSWT